MHLRNFFGRLRLRRRPPTGPLTTAETTAADELRQETQARDSERTALGERPARNAHRAGKERLARRVAAT